MLPTYGSAGDLRADPRQLQARIGRRPWRRDKGRQVACLVVALLAAASLGLYALTHRTGERALVLYIYYPSDDDPEFTANFRYFVREGIQAGDGNDYIIVLQLDEGKAPPELPPLPTNARYLTHNNACFDIGTHGWVLDNHVTLRRYKYFFFMNSGVRGPFLPSWAAGTHWTRAFTDRLRGPVKMGLDVLRAAGVLACHADWEEAIRHGELGAARALFKAGYSIDCLMQRYQGVDWRDPELSKCNAQLQPIQNDFYDGISVQPFEVLFVKVKSTMLEARWTAAREAVRYDAWAAQVHVPKHERLHLLTSNTFVDEAPARLEAFKAVGARCFDAQFYIRASIHDLKPMLDQPDLEEAAFKHFMTSGYMEGRPYRFTC